MGWVLNVRVVGLWFRVWGWVGRVLTTFWITALRTVKLTCGMWRCSERTILRAAKLHSKSDLEPVTTSFPNIKSKPVQTGEVTRIVIAANLVYSYGISAQVSGFRV